MDLALSIRQHKAQLIGGFIADQLQYAEAGAVHLPEAGLMAVASVAGGWVGAHVAQRLPAAAMRLAVVSFALLVAGKLFLER